MIYVIDNGLDYSDHTVYFVESECSPAFVREWVALSGFTIVAIADAFEWLKGGPTTLDSIYFRALWYGTASERDQRQIASHMRDRWLAEESGRVLQRLADVQVKARAAYIEWSRTGDGSRNGNGFKHDRPTDALLALINRGFMEPKR